MVGLNVSGKIKINCGFIVNPTGFTMTRFNKKCHLIATALQNLRVNEESVKKNSFDK